MHSRPYGLMRGYSINSNCPPIRKTPKNILYVNVILLESNLYYPFNDMIHTWEQINSLIENISVQSVG